MKKFELAEDIFIIEDFFSREECNDFIFSSELRGYEAAKVDIDGKQVMLTSVRNNSRITFKDEALAEELWEKVMPYCVATVGMSQVIGLNEMFRFYKYAPGQRFKSHIDGSYQRNDKEFSLYTFMVYLNDDFTGGETGFKHLDIKPKAGTALIFKHSLRHEGKPIIEGEKYVLRTDIMYRLD